MYKNQVNSLRAAKQCNSLCRQVVEFFQGWRLHSYLDVVLSDLPYWSWCKLRGWIGLHCPISHCNCSVITYPDLFVPRFLKSLIPARNMNFEITYFITFSFFKAVIISNLYLHCCCCFLCKKCLYYTYKVSAKHNWLMSKIKKNPNNWFASYRTSQQLSLKTHEKLYILQQWMSVTDIWSLFQNYLFYKKIIIQRLETKTYWLHHWMQGFLVFFLQFKIDVATIFSIIKLHETKQ